MIVVQAGKEAISEYHVETSPNWCELNIIGLTQKLLSEMASSITSSPTKNKRYHECGTPMPCKGCHEGNVKSDMHLSWVDYTIVQMKEVDILISWVNILLMMSTIYWALVLAYMYLYVSLINH